MRIGKLDVHGQFQTPVQASDSFGGTRQINPSDASDWSNFKAAWVSVGYKFGYERQKTDQLSAESHHELWTWYQSGITPSMRFLADDGRIFSIIEIDQTKRRDNLMRLIVRELV